MSLSLAERCRRFLGQCTACKDYRAIISNWEIMAKDFQRLSHEWESRYLKVEKEVKSILWINECHCDEAYTGRHMHAPNSICGELDELAEAITTGSQPGKNNE